MSTGMLRRREETHESGKANLRFFFLTFNGADNACENERGAEQWRAGARNRRSSL